MFKQIQLGYDFKALEPHIDQLTMETHYGKHHAAYTNNLNNALKNLPELAGQSIEAILIDLDRIKDPALKTAVRNNGGGYYNHNLYFDILSPPKGAGNPRANWLSGSKRISVILAALKRSCPPRRRGSLVRAGPGWRRIKRENLLSPAHPTKIIPPHVPRRQTHAPLVGIDVWEHAYYLKYKNVRADYIQALFNVIDWERVAKLYSSR